MKKNALICLLSLVGFWVGITSAVIAQSADFLWVEQVGGPNAEEGNSVSIDPYGNIVVTGFFADTTTFGDTTLVSTGGRDVFIAKYDRDGHLLWVVNAGGAYDDLGNNVTVDNNANIYVVGHATGTCTFGDSTLNLPNNKNTAFVVKYNSLGKFQWVRAFPGTNSNTDGIGVTASSEGSLYMAIDFNIDIIIGDTTFTGHSDGLLLKLDTSGQFLWGEQIDGSYPNPVYMADVAVDGNNNCFVAGNFFHDSLSIGDTTLVSTGGEDIFLAKYRPDGTLEWVKQGAGSSKNEAYDVATDPEGNVFLCGDYFTQAIFDTLLLVHGGAFIVRYDNQGNVQWGKSLGTTNGVKAFSVAAGPDGSITMVGWYRGQIMIGDTTFTTGQFDLNALMVNYDKNGDFSWALQAGGINGSSNQDYAFGVAMDVTGAAVVTGYFQGTATFNDTTLTSYDYHDAFVAKILEGQGLFPQIVVSPMSIHVTLHQDSSTSVNLSIQNIGSADLNWTLTKQDSGSTLGDSLGQIIAVSPFSVGGIAYDPDLNAVWVCDPLFTDIYLYEKTPPYNRILTLDMPGNVPGHAVDVAVKDSLLYITDPDVLNNTPFDDLIFAINKYTGSYVQTWFVDGLYNHNPVDSIERIVGITCNDAGEFFVTSDSSDLIRKIALYPDGSWESLATYTSPYFERTGTISWDAAHQGFWLSHIQNPDFPYYFTDTTFQPITALPKLNRFNQTIGVVPTDTLWLGNTPYVTVVDGRLHACDWFTSDISMGALIPGNATTVSAAIDPSGLEPGTYTCYLEIRSNDPFQPVLTIPVVLTVEPVSTYNVVWLGTLGGDLSDAYAVSGNGRYIAGSAMTANGEQHAFRYDLYTGIMEDLGTLGGNISEAFGISDDGRFVVGGSLNANFQPRAFRWDAQTGVMQELGSFGGNFSRAYAVSEDGNYVVGWAYNSNGDQRAFRWDVQTGAMEDLGTLGGAESIAFAVSDDGRYVVGNAQKADGFWHAFRWDAQTGIMQSLGTLGGQESFAHGIAADGNYVVGAAQLPNGSAHAFRWSEHNNNMIDLGTLGNPPGTARDISEDGNYVVGESRNNNFEWRAFRWVSASNTLEDLNITFATLLDNGSVLHYARSITPNGRFIVGKGFNAATGREEAYLLDALSLVTSVEPTAETPRNFELFQNYPNPFNPVTALRYQLPVGGDVQLTIYDILGRKVRSLVHQRQSAGQYLVRWDGTNDAGEPVSSGVYLYRLTVNRTNGNPFVKTRKMVLLK